MTIHLMKCGICNTMNSIGHCRYCGAMRVSIGREVKYYNAQGIEMVRGVPTSVKQLLKRAERMVAV